MKKTLKIILLCLIVGLSFTMIQQLGLQINTLSNSKQKDVIKNKVQGVMTTPFNITSDKDFLSVPGITGIGTINNPFNIANLNIEANGNMGIGIFNITSYFNIQNVKLNGSYNSFGILIYNSSHGTLQNNYINASSTGIAIESYSKQILVTNNTVENSNFAFKVLYANETTFTNNKAMIIGNSGFYIFLSFNDTVDNNTIIDSFYGIIVIGSYFDSFLDNYASNCTIGIDIQANSNVFTNNYLQFNDYGIYDSGSLNEITNNTVDYNNIAGITVGTSSYETIAHNIAEFNGRGIILTTNSQENYVGFNTLSNNILDGLQLLNYVSNNTIEENIAEFNGGNGFSISSNVNSTIVYGNNARNNLGNGFFIEADSYLNNISYNQAINNTQAGFALKNHANKNIIKCNNISLNAIGISIDYASQQNKLFKNTMLKNKVSDAWDDSVASNYWSGNNYTDYTGYYYIIPGNSQAIDQNAQSSITSGTVEQPITTVTEIQNQTVTITETTVSTTDAGGSTVTTTETQTGLTNSTPATSDGFMITMVLLAIGNLIIIKSKRRNK